MSLLTSCEERLNSETPLCSFRGLSAGLNARPNAGRVRALLYVLPSAVVIGVERPRFPRNKIEVERFDRPDIMRVIEDVVAKTGLEGAMARKNATHPIGRLMGASSSGPALILQSRRGDIVFAFRDREAGIAREAFAAISDMLG